MVDDIICKVWWDFGSLNNDNILPMQQSCHSPMLNSVGIENLKKMYFNQFQKVAENINL